MWKKNVLEELETGKSEFETVGEFLTKIKKKFGGEETESVKAAKLKKLKQRGKTIEEFVQEFKSEINGVIRRKLMEAKNQPSSIKQWYRRATALDRN